jgi:hypothetical protein
MFIDLGTGLLHENFGWKLEMMLPKISLISTVLISRKDFLLKLLHVVLLTHAELKYHNDNHRILDFWFLPTSRRHQNSN